MKLDIPYGSIFQDISLYVVNWIMYKNEVEKVENEEDIFKTAEMINAAINRSCVTVSRKRFELRIIVGEPLLVNLTKLLEKFTSPRIASIRFKIDPTRNAITRENFLKLKFKDKNWDKSYYGGRQLRHTIRATYVYSRMPPKDFIDFIKHNGLIRAVNIYFDTQISKDKALEVISRFKDAGYGVQIDERCNKGYLLDLRKEMNFRIQWYDNFRENITEDLAASNKCLYNSSCITYECRVMPDLSIVYNTCEQKTGDKLTPTFKFKIKNETCKKECCDKLESNKHYNVIHINHIPVEEYNYDFNKRQL